MFLTITSSAMIMVAFELYCHLFSSVEIIYYRISIAEILDHTDYFDFDY